MPPQTTDTTRQAIEQAIELAREYGAVSVNNAHLLIGLLLSDQQLRETFHIEHVEIEDIQEIVAKYTHSVSPTSLSFSQEIPEQLPYHERMETALAAAGDEALEHEYDVISPALLAYTVLQDDALVHSLGLTSPHLSVAVRIIATPAQTPVVVTSPVTNDIINDLQELRDTAAFLLDRIDDLTRRLNRED